MYTCEVLSLQIVQNVVKAVTKDAAPLLADADVSRVHICVGVDAHFEPFDALRIVMPHQHITL